MMLAESYTVIIKNNSRKVNAAMVIAIKIRHEPPQGDPRVRRTGGSFLVYQSIGASNCVRYYNRKQQFLKLFKFFSNLFKIFITINDR